MEKYRTELRVPVDMARKTFADRHRERLGIDQDERSVHFSTSPEHKTLHSTPWHKPFSNGSLNSSDFTEGDDWFEEMRRRFEERRRKWNEDVKRMRQEFFTLDSNDLRKSASPPRLLLPHGTVGARKPFSGTLEKCSDGSMQFVANFDVCGFSPEELRVTIRGNEVVVSAKTEKHSGSSRSSKEYTRSVTLPEGFNEEQANATLTTDGVLTFICPLNQGPEEKRFTSPEVDTQNADGRGPIGWHDRSRIRKTDRSTPYSHSPQSVRTDYDSSSSLSYIRPKFRLEIPIDSDYSPAEIQIRTLNHRLYVTARHEERCSNRTAVREFSKEYDIPENVDPECLEAKLENGTLYIEASSK